MTCSVVNCPNTPTHEVKFNDPDTDQTYITINVCDDHLLDSQNIKTFRLRTVHAILNGISLDHDDNL